MISTANGHAIVECQVHLPRVGVWHADLVVDTQTPADVAGTIALSLVDGQLLLTGKPVRTPTLWRGLTRVRMAAGAAGMGTQLGPQGYRGVTARVVVGDILAGAGERLSPTADAGLLSTQLTTWARLAASAGSCLKMIVDSLGATWRSALDGTVWIGTESWPSSALKDYDVTDRSPEDGRLEVVTPTPVLVPGTTLEGSRIGRVTYLVTSEAVRVEAFVDDG